MAASAQPAATKTADAAVTAPRIEPSPGIGDEPEIAPRVTESERTEFLSFPGPGTSIAHSSDQGWIGVSRLTVFLQGVLLAVVALVFFVLGMMVGRQAGGTASHKPLGPAELTGTVTYVRDGSSHSDDGAVVAILPTALRPDEKLTVEGLRAGDPRPSDLHESVVTIRDWGGDYVRADRNGRFRLRVPHGGEFFLLVISAHADRGADRPELRDLAQIGRFFLPAVDLLEDRAYRWATISVSGNRSLGTVALGTGGR